MSAQQVSWITAANYGTCKTCAWRGLTSRTRLYASSVSRCRCCPVWTWATATMLMTSPSTFWPRLGPPRGTPLQKSTYQVRADRRPITFSPTPPKRAAVLVSEAVHSLKQICYFDSKAWQSLVFSLLCCSVQPCHRPFPKLFQALRKHLSDRPPVLQAGDQDGMRAVHRGDVRERALQTARGETPAESQLVRKRTEIFWLLIW